MLRFEKAEAIKRDMKKAQALEKAYKQGTAPEAATSDGSDDEEDEDKIAEEKEAGGWLRCCGLGVCVLAPSHGASSCNSMPLWTLAWPLWLAAPIRTELAEAKNTARYAWGSACTRSVRWPSAGLAMTIRLWHPLIETCICSAALTPPLCPSCDPPVPCNSLKGQ